MSLESLKVIELRDERKQISAFMEKCMSKWLQTFLRTERYSKKDFIL